ncbi:MAG: hypothetical protein KDE27_13085 [Planctomycetes bacterium]|nr:hypothetical protein [Planctomycetota bacterium]
MKPQPVRPPGRRRRFVLSSFVGVTSALLAAAAVRGQDAIRVWGVARYDTDALSQPIDEITAHEYVAAFRRSDGRVYVLGSNAVGYSQLPAATLAYTAIALGSTFGLALRSDGRIESWGAGGGLPAPPLPTGVSYVELAAGAVHAVALRSDGVVVAWGDNSYGQTNVPALPAGTSVRQLRVCSYESMLLLGNGTIVTFGPNFGGIANVPVLPTGVFYDELWTGTRHAIAHRTDGALVAWGDNMFGQGNIPALPAGVTYTAMALGHAHTVAIRSDGVVLAFGENGSGQSTVPALPAGAVPATVAAGRDFSLLRLANGEVTAWGDTRFLGPTAALPAGTRWTGLAAALSSYGLTSAGEVVALTGATTAVPALPPGMSYTAIDAGSSHGVALRSDGRAVTWGSNSHGQLAIPPLPPGLRYVATDSGWARTVLLRSDGQAFENGYGMPVIPPPPPGVHYVEIACHDQATMLRRSDGEVVHVDRTGNVSILAALPPGIRRVDVAIGRTFAAVLRSDGEIDLPSTLHSPLPPLPRGVVYVEIDSAEDDLVARRSDGEVVGASSGFNGGYTGAVPPLFPGESYVEIDGGYLLAAARVGPTRSYVTFGSGCAGSLPAARLVPSDTPYIGGHLDVHIFDLPQDTAIVAFGWNRVPPTPLATFGMPGCNRHVSLDAALLIAGADGVAEWPLAIPNVAGLVGQRFHNQAIVFDPNVNAAGAVVSDAAEAVIGER